MYQSTLLSEPRELNKEELDKVSLAQEKWYPHLIQTYNTSLYDMMSNPYKKGIIIFLVLIILLILVLFVYKNFVRSGKKPNKLELYYLIGVFCFILFIVVSNIIKQYKLNQNLLLVLSYTKPNSNPTKYDYESSSVIQSQLMRKSMSGGRGSGSSSGLIGAAVGYGLGRKRR